MKNEVKQAFARVHADEALKAQTMAALQQRRAVRAPRRSAWLMPLAACLALLLLGWGGYALYFVPTSVISVDINPSLELSVNRLDRVIAVQGYNPDGEALAEELDLWSLTYTEAVEQVLQSPVVMDCRAQGGVVSITVVTEDSAQSQRMLGNVQACTAGQKDTYCYAAPPEEVEAAHAVGLSYGKYRAYLEAQAQNPDLTPEDVQGMTMREIRDLIQPQESQTGSGQQGGGKGHGKGWAGGRHNS